MNVRVHPSTLSGAVPAVASKSMAHRMLILATLSPEPCQLTCSTTSEDIEATRRCLAALARGETMLDCGESGSTLRFLVPIVCALGTPAHMVCHGRLVARPLAPLDEQLELHGAQVSKTDEGWDVSGQIDGGRYVLPGNVSSQYVSGILLAAPLFDSTCEILVECPVQSRPYIDLTIQALSLFGVPVTCSHLVEDGVAYECFEIPPVTPHAQDHMVVEGDWSNAAFWLAAGALEPEGITVGGLDPASVQGDRAVLAALAAFGARIARKGSSVRATADCLRAATLDVSAIPDLVPPLAAVAAQAPQTSRFTNAGRLRLKESDRLATICATIQALGGHARIEGDDLVITGVTTLIGGVVDAANDHRIAMMAALMAAHATGSTTICGAECVAKSYPTFWDDFELLGGSIERLDDTAPSAARGKE